MMLLFASMLRLVQAMVTAALAQQTIIAQHQAQQALFKQQREQAQSVRRGTMPRQRVPSLWGEGRGMAHGLGGLWFHDWRPPCGLVRPRVWRSQLRAPRTDTTRMRPACPLTQKCSASRCAWALAHFSWPQLCALFFFPFIFSTLGCKLLVPPLRCPAALPSRHRRRHCHASKWLFSSFFSSAPCKPKLPRVQPSSRCRAPP